jgi:hypothetical protein
MVYYRSARIVLQSDDSGLASIVAKVELTDALNEVHALASVALAITGASRDILAYSNTTLEPTPMYRFAVTEDDVTFMHVLPELIVLGCRDGSMALLEYTQNRSPKHWTQWSWTN